MPMGRWCGLVLPLLLLAPAAATAELPSANIYFWLLPIIDQGRL